MDEKTTLVGTQESFRKYTGVFLEKLHYTSENSDVTCRECFTTKIKHDVSSLRSTRRDLISITGPVDGL